MISGIVLVSGIVSPLLLSVSDVFFGTNKSWDFFFLASGRKKKKTYCGKGPQKNQYEVKVKTNAPG